MPKADRTRNIVQAEYLESTFNIDSLYIFHLTPNEYNSYIDENILPENIKFIDVIDVSKKGFSLVIEIQNNDRYIIVFENPFDLNKIIKLINKGKENKEELSRSQLPTLKFNIDYFENLLRTEVQKEFTLQVFNNLSV
jgi:hypothetical protein